MAATNGTGWEVQRYTPDEGWRCFIGPSLTRDEAERWLVLARAATYSPPYRVYESLNETR